MGDIGSLLKIEGIVVGGAGTQAVLMLPNSVFISRDVHSLSTEEWSDYLQRSDVPELLMPDKAFHRKVRYEISGHAQQKIWVADGFKCMFCQKKMGDVQLSIDHFIPLELGGANNQSNYLSACRKCNKDKGSIPPEAFCQKKGLDYSKLVEYLKLRKV